MALYFGKLLFTIFLFEKKNALSTSKCVFFYLIKNVTTWFGLINTVHAKHTVYLPISVDLWKIIRFRQLNILLCAKTEIMYLTTHNGKNNFIVTLSANRLNVWVHSSIYYNKNHSDRILNFGFLNRFVMLIN